MVAMQCDKQGTISICLSKFVIVVRVRTFIFLTSKHIIDEVLGVVAVSLFGIVLGRIFSLAP